VLFAPLRAERGWLEQDLERRARDEFGVHVSTGVVAERSLPGPGAARVRARGLLEG
jgi:hypothetical protein